MTRSTAGALVHSLLALVLIGPVAAQDVDISPASPSPHPGFGSNVTGWGQTFTAPTVERYLDSFSFNLGDITASFGFRSFIYAWDGNTTGATVWSGGLRTLSSADDGYQTFHTGHLGLNPGATYIALLESDRPMYGYDWGTANPIFGGDAYAGGSMLLSFGGTSYIYDGQTHESSPGNYYTMPSYDTSFRADFAAGTVTPEPMSMALLGTGLAGLGALRRRRRRASE